MGGPDIARSRVTDADLRSLGLVPYGEALAALAAERPDDAAVVFDRAGAAHRSVTFAELDDLARRAAAGLSRRGIGAGDTVAVVIGNSVELVALGFAVWRVGACFLPVAPSLPAPERAALLGVAQPSLVVTGAPAADVATATADDLLACDPLPQHRHPIAWPGKAIGSGGSTGRPKAIVFDRPWAWAADAGDNEVWRRMGLRPGMRLLVAGPLYHNWHFDLCFNGLAAGCPIVLMERFDAGRAVQLIRRHRIQYVGLVPTMMRRIIQLPDLDPADLDSLEGLCHTAAPCPPSLKHRWLDLLGPERVYELYGATEGFGLTIIRGDEWLAHPGSVGRPVDTRVRIVDEAGDEVGAGTVGTIFASRTDPAEHAVYAGAPPAPTTGDGFGTVGDLGWVDEDGFLYLADRRNDLIITGGVNVYPAEVEAALCEHPAVADCAVVGVADEEWGQRVTAVVELLPGAVVTPADLRDHCARRLAKPKVPKDVEIVSQLPRTEAGKLRRSALVGDRG